MVEMRFVDFVGKPIKFETAVEIVEAVQMTDGAIRIRYNVEVVEEKPAEDPKEEKPVKFKTVDFGPDPKKETKEKVK